MASRKRSLRTSSRGLGFDGSSRRSWTQVLGQQVISDASDNWNHPTQETEGRDPSQARVMNGVDI